MTGRPRAGLDSRRLAADEQLRAHDESRGIDARVLDNERARKAVRLADTADRHTVAHAS
jgi:hypothetical protein